MKSSAWSVAELNTKTSPEMRDLAHRLLTCEAIVGEIYEPMESATLRVYEKLRQSLGVIVGAAGFKSLASRALALARSEVPSLGAVRISGDGFLQGLEKLEHPIDTRKDHVGKDQAGEYPASEAGIILIARLLGLLHIFLGEALTSSLLRNAWPGAIFDNRNSGNGRKA